MGRSKFPGKPSKHVNRTRVNVLAAATATTNAVLPLVNNANATAAAAVASNGTLFVGANGDANSTVNDAGSLATTTTATTAVDEDEEQHAVLQATNPVNTSTPKSANVNRKRLQVRKTANNNVNNNNNNKKKKTKKRVSVARSPIKRTRLLPVNSPLTRSRVNTHKTVRFSKTPTPLRNNVKKTEALVGKFVLPSRSAHSSRVIKPNKRFINPDQETRIIRKRVRRTCTLRHQQNGTSENVVAADVSKELCDTSEVKDSSPAGDSSEVPSDTSTTMTTTPSPLSSNGRVVLRQARLQLNTRVPCASTEGPFSTSSVNQISSSRTITCGVCGAVRFYRLVKHARKFNIYCCESCRKFIAKLIKRAAIKSAPPPTLNCHKGQGLCHVPPNVRSQLWKFGTQYNTRCPACWLKLCLRSFQLPIALKTSLTKLLPKYMQPNETSLFGSANLPPLAWQSLPESSKDNPALAKTPSPPNENNTLQLRQRSVRLKQPKNAPAAPQLDVKRAKIDLKGPRVKHVCRSASIVLGQLPATFSHEPVKTVKFNDEVEEIPPRIDSKKPLDIPIRNDIPPDSVKSALKSDNKIDANENKIAAPIALPPAPIEEDNKEEIAPTLPTAEPVPTVPILAAKSNKVKQQQLTNPLSMLPLEITKPSFNKRNRKISPQEENPNMLNIDFWENYDPDEVVCSGYSIIASETFPMRAICFLCGSAGKETLIHCCVCCEPYHPYCLEQGISNLHHSDQKFSWICPKCTTCSACGEADKQKINCQKCHKAYHPQCFNHKWRTDDRPTVCSNCLRCKSCGTDNITKFVGNLALCLACFKLRNKGNFCPLCQCCYDDNDFDTKMMECGKCNKWVHAKCEGLSDEQYQILSILPESVEFICCLCATDSSPPYWRNAVQQELRSCLNNILRLVSKNRVARETLKLSPLKCHTITSNKLLSARRLQFIDDQADSEASNDADNSIDNELEHVNAIFKNKIDFGDSFNNSATGGLNDSKLPMSPRMVEIKNKVNCNEYFSLREFNEGMEHALSSTSDGTKLLEIYHSILKNVLPWFDPNVKEELNTTLDTSRIESKHDSDDNSKTKEKNKFDRFDVQAPKISDTRICNLCKGVGDGEPEKEARLLYCGQNEWVHSNCALWSSEVYEEIDGSLQNVQSAICRGRSIRCSHCKQKGASVGCCLKGCHETYHFSCAQQAESIFIGDRTMYCHSHEIPSNLNIITNPSDFAIRRSVYIEVDKKKKKLCDRERVRYMVGSLSVISLGKIIPSVSDTVDAIIPVGFVCWRLFWSTTEPWKLIPYKITTSILNTHSEVYVDKNFTVDHTLSRGLVEKKLKEILLWQKEEKERADVYEFEDYEEPQNAGDILSPELTDAILEELPHDLLDGLSMQDMLKEYEELMNMEINCNDNLTLNVSADKEDGVSELHIKELKRSKSEVFQKIDDKKLKPRNQQRSCSLAWLQIDNTLSPAIKKRKITAPSFMQIVQVDGACDSSGSECGSPTHESEDVWAPDADVKCEKCHCTYRTKISYERHLQTCEAMFTSESETEEITNVSATEEQSQVIYESFSYQTTQNQIQSTVLNTQTILESKTQTQVQDAAGIIYNYQAVKPAIVTQPPATANLVEGASIISASQFCVNQLNAPASQCIIPVDNSHSQVINSINPINQATLVDPVAIQPVPYTSDVSSFINLGQQNQAITIDAKMLAPVLNLQQNQWAARPVMAQKVRAKPRAVVKQQPRMVQVLPQNSPSVILQHIPSTGMLPFVDATAFQQQASQGVQYVVAPQVSQMNAPTAQLVQLPENNFLSLVQNVPQVQPTMIIQQPRVDAGQIIFDSNGSMLWTQPIVQPPVQPVYYGIETVQTTVMQSQQFLPTTMPGMLTTNSSFSATTQVFQTSKLEPVLEGGYVLVNQNPLLNQNQIVNNTVQLPQITASVSTCPNVQSIQIKAAQTPLPTVTTPITATAAPIATVSIPVQATGSLSISQPTITVPTTTWNSNEAAQLKPIHVVTAPITTSIPTTSIQSNTTNSITLPLAPFVSEQGIPTNIVTPTPKPAPVQQARPMSRVLPMQTSATQKKPVEKDKAAEKRDSKFSIIGDIIIKQNQSDVVSSSEEKIPIRNFKVEISKEIPGITLDMPLLVTKVEATQPEVKIEIKEEPVKPITETIKSSVESKPKIISEKAADRIFALNLDAKLKENKEGKDKEILKVNKIPVAPFKPMKPKIINSGVATINKENMYCDNPQEPKYAKRSNSPSIYFKIETDEGFEYVSTSLPHVWRKVFNDVQAARTKHNLPPLPEIALRAFNDLDVLGLKTKGMRFLIEQLPEAVKCKQYKPLYHKPKDPYLFDDDDDDDTARRCIPYTTKKEKYDMFGWLSSKHRTLEMYDLDAVLKKNASSSLPMAMRFRALKVISKYSVGVYRSDIHGRGLFSLRNIESGEMVIEYAGEVIRSVLTDKREKYYNTKGIGCYMFRIDDNLVVDATMKGNAARFINHSCDPNCYSKVVEILGNKHIIIFALRKIICGEELTYDYKFPFEEDKIPCTCGTRRCRKFLN